jgi:hypothetical protein
MWFPIVVAIGLVAAIGVLATQADETARPAPEAANAAAANRARAAAAFATWADSATPALREMRTYAHDIVGASLDGYGYAVTGSCADAAAAVPVWKQQIEPAPDPVLGRYTAAALAAFDAGTKQCSKAGNTQALQGAVMIARALSPLEMLLSRGAPLDSLA